MAFIEQEVRHMVVARIDEEPFHASNASVGGMHVLAAAHLNLPQGHTVASDGMCIGPSP